ncbi:MAG TPA: Pr6Pr family membrane protein [Chitinophagaceae bacterium]|nr:Pr6Pr family membrane protein [Chitinophagaceae bacterium]
MIPQKYAASLIVLIGWFALSLQLFVSIKNAPALGVAIAESIVNYFSYFTILSNLAVAVSLSILLIFPGSALGRFFAKPASQTAIALYIFIVGLVYSIALRNVWDPKGLQKTADILLHDVIPILYLLFWFLFVPKKTLKWQNAFSWLIFPFIYLLYALLRGATTGWFSYYFLNFKEYGWGKVTINIILVLLAFLAVAMFLILIDRVWKKKLR